MSSSSYALVLLGAGAGRVPARLGSRAGCDALLARAPGRGAKSRQ